MSRIWYHIKEGFMGVFRHLAMSLSSSSAVTITLILVSVFLLFNAVLQHITVGIEESIQVVVKIQDEYNTDESVAAIENKILSFSGVQSATYSSKDEELQAFIDSFPDGAGEAMGTYKGDNNPLNAGIIVMTKSGTNLENLFTQIKAIEGVDRILDASSTIINFVENLAQVRYYAFAVVIVLSLLAIFLIANTIRITIFSRSKEISIMRTVGATNNFIRTPFLIEGMIIGLIGSIIPIAVICFGYNYIYVINNGYLITRMFTMPTVYPLIFETSLTIMGMGIAVGFIGSFISVTRHLRWSR